MATIGEGPTLGLALTAALTAGKRELVAPPSRVERPTLPRFPTPFEHRQYETEMRAYRRAGHAESLRDEAARRGVSLYRVRTERAEREGLSRRQGAGKPGKGEAPMREARVTSKARALAPARAGGLGVRVRMAYRISRTVYTKDLPSGAKWQRLGPKDIEGALALWAAGDVEAAGDELESLFNAKYWAMRPTASGRMVSDIAGGDIQLDGEDDESGTPLGVTYAWVMIGHP